MDLLSWHSNWGCDPFKHLKILLKVAKAWGDKLQIFVRENNVHGQNLEHKLLKSCKILHYFQLSMLNH